MPLSTTNPLWPARGQSRLSPGSIAFYPRPCLKQALEALNGAREADNLILVNAELLGADEAVIHLPRVTQLAELELQRKLHIAVSITIRPLPTASFGGGKAHLGTRRPPKLSPLLGLAGDVLSLVARDAAPLVHHLAEGPLLERDVGVLAEALGSTGDRLTDPDSRVDGHVAGEEHLGIGVGRDDLDVLSGSGLHSLSTLSQSLTPHSNDQIMKSSSSAGATHHLKRPKEREEGHVLRVVPKVEVRGLGRQLGQLRLDPLVDVGFVVHVWGEVLALEPPLGAGRGGPEVVLERGLRCGRARELHALLLLDVARLLRRLASEEVLPPVGDGEDGAHALLGIR